jgi:hypothetical protein
VDTFYEATVYGHEMSDYECAKVLYFLDGKGGGPDQQTSEGSPLSFDDYWLSMHNWWGRSALAARTTEELDHCAEELGLAVTEVDGKQTILGSWEGKQSPLSALALDEWAGTDELNRIFAVLPARYGLGGSPYPRKDALVKVLSLPSVRSGIEDVLGLCDLPADWWDSTIFDDYDSLIESNIIENVSILCIPSLGNQREYYVGAIVRWTSSRYEAGDGGTFCRDLPNEKEIARFLTKVGIEPDLRMYNLESNWS